MFYVYQTHWIKIFNLPNKASSTYFSYLWAVTICLSLSVIWRNLEGAACSYREQQSSDGPGVSDMAYDTRYRIDWLTSVLKGFLLPWWAFTICYCGLSFLSGQQWSTVKLHVEAAPLQLSVGMAASHVCFCFLGGAEWRWAIEVEKNNTFVNRKEQLIFGTTMSKLGK